MKRILICLCCFLLVGFSGKAQRTRSLKDHIKSIELHVNGSKSSLPCLRFGANDLLHVSFDDLGEQNQRYSYRLQHCNMDWTLNEELFESEYVTATGEEMLIEDYELSRNTTCPYTHYSFTLPNANMRPLLSGNYLITISDEAGETVAEAFFCIVEPKVAIKASVSTDTDIDWNGTHQQIALEINTNTLDLRYPEEEISIVVLQNYRWDNAVIAPEATSCPANKMIWLHSRELIFDAGNEYRKFELTSTKYPGMGIDRIRPYEEGFKAYLMTDEQRKNYIYDRDQDGISVVRVEPAIDSNVEADYVLMQFSLASPPIENAEVYVLGQWNAYQPSEEYRMNYVHGMGYVADILLKQGYYNYMYLTRPEGKDGFSTLPYEGNFYQTQNQYTILVYFRAQGSRYTRLVGRSEINYSHQ